MTDMSHYQLLKSMGTTEIERQNIRIKEEYHEPISRYIRELELKYLTKDCLEIHNITSQLRARMVDWMIEVLTNFKCDD